jgi:Xaa-Pro dipeptidase
MGVRRPYCRPSDRDVPPRKNRGDKITLYVHPENHNRMRTPDASGREQHWIFGIHFVDRVREIGGFYEELVTIV